MSDLLIMGFSAPTFLTLGLGETYGRRDPTIEDFRKEPVTKFVDKPSGVAIEDKPSELIDKPAGVDIEEVGGTMVEFK